MKSYEKVITRIREWLNDLPEGEVSWHEWSDDYSGNFEVKPLNPAACSVTLSIAKNSPDFDVSVGTVTTWSDAPLSSDGLPLEVLNTVRRGRVREEIIKGNGKLLRTYCEMHLPSGTWFDNGYELWSLVSYVLFWKRQKEVIEYEPW